MLAKAFVKDANGCLDSTTYSIQHMDAAAPNAVAQNITIYLDSATGMATANADIDNAVLMIVRWPFLWIKPHLTVKIEVITPLCLRPQIQMEEQALPTLRLKY